MGRYIVVRRIDLRDSDTWLRRLPWADSTIDQWLAAPLTRANAIEMLRAAGQYVQPSGAPVDANKALKTALLTTFERGDLCAIDTPLSSGTGGGEDADSQSPPQRGSASPGSGATGSPGSGGSSSGTSSGQSSADPNQKTWFQCQLLDEDGEPMAKEDYTLVTTDGQNRKGTLDAGGTVYVPPILPPGDCTIGFPNMHLNPRKKPGA